MKRGSRIALWALVPVLAWVGLGMPYSCAYCDQLDIYHLSGRLVSSLDGKPVAGASVVGSVHLDHAPPDAYWKEFSSDTDANGEFHVRTGVLSGGLQPVPLIRWYASPPRQLNAVAVYIGKDSKWRKIVIPLAESQQLHKTETERWIEVGQLRLDPNGPTVTTHPTGSSPSE
jgi:hypothetical protein